MKLADTIVLHAGGVGSGRHATGTRVKVNLPDEPDNPKHNKIGRVAGTNSSGYQEVAFSNKQLGRGYFLPKNLIPIDNGK